MRHMCGCEVRLRIVEGPGFMQLELCGLHDMKSHAGKPRKVFLFKTC
jgi:hypothetical protein